MSQGKWVDKWSVQSENDNEKFYTVSRAEDGSFGCSCPQWIFRHQTCKHIEGVARTIVGLTPTELRTANRLRLISVLHHMKLSCDNCGKFGVWGCVRWRMRQNLLFVKGLKQTFYVLGRACVHYEKIKE